MDLLDRILMDLESLKIDNVVYLFDETETEYYEQTKKIVNKNYGFFDIVPDLSDYGKLKEQINKLNSSLKYDIVKNYLFYKIFIKADIDKTFYEEQLNKLLNGNFITDYVDISLDYVGKIKEKAKNEKNGYARIHFFLDNIDSISLQKAINNLIYARCFISVVCYTTKGLKTCSTTYGGFDIIQEAHDYRKVKSDKKEKIDNKVYLKKIER